MTPPDPLRTALDLAAVSPAKDAFVIASVDDATNRYAQFMPSPGGGLLGELVGNRYLAPEHRLSAAQQDQVRARGWRGDGDENWSRDLPSPASAEDRHRVADEAVAVLREVYLATGPLRVEANLDAESQRVATAAGVQAASATPIPRWVLGLGAVGLLLMVLLLLGVF